MSKSTRKLSSIVILWVLILPIIFFVFILIPHTLYSILTTHISGLDKLFSTLGIAFLIFHLAPPPPYKQKRIRFVKAFKTIFKKFFKPESTEETVFKDDVVHFTAFDHLNKESKSKSNSSKDFLLDSTLINDNPHDNSARVFSIASTNRLNPKKAKKSKFISSLVNFTKYFQFRSASNFNFNNSFNSVKSNRQFLGGEYEKSQLKYFGFLFKIDIFFLLRGENTG